MRRDPVELVAKALAVATIAAVLAAVLALKVGAWHDCRALGAGPWLCAELVLRGGR